MPSPRTLETDEEEILDANRAFYQALQSLDISQMEALWWHEDWVTCLHPGWELIFGWEDVRMSWANIFRSTAQMRITLARSLAHVEGNVGWVSCVESVTSAYDEGFETAMVEATNLFVRRNGEWRVVHHHTSPIPGRVPSGTSRRIQ